MELRAQKTACLLALVLAGAAAAQEFRYQVRHQHVRKGCAGLLQFDANGLEYRQTDGKRKHAWKLAYTDIQQLELRPGEVRVLTYVDNKWKLGADRELDFRLTGSGENVEPLYRMLRGKLDQRLVAALADEDVAPLWQLPVKRLARLSGSQGVLIVGRDRVVYRAAKGESRTWRFEDIENVSTPDPFHLTLTTYERALAHYGNRKDFNFQLKQALSEDRYNQLWRRVQQDKGLKLVKSSETEN